MNLYGYICLSDIPKELVTEGKNGKKYLSIEVNELREPSQYGTTHAVKVSVKKEQKREGVNYYVGNLKPSKYGNNESDESKLQPTTAEQPPLPANDDDLPF